MLNPVVVNKYMQDLGALLENLNLKESPASIWNCDETSRNFEHNPTKVIGEKSARNVLGRTSNNRTIKHQCLKSTDSRNKILCL